VRDPDRASARAKSDAALSVKIDAAWDANRKLYGARKIWHVLRRQGEDPARCTVERLMRRLGIRGVVRGKKVITTNPDTSLPCPDDKVNRLFMADRRYDLAESTVFGLGSGTGFAPLKAIIEHMRHAGLTRPTTLYWGCRSKADLYLHDWAAQQAAELPWLTYVPVLSDAKPEDEWSGRTGFVHQAVLADLPDLSAHEVYACGAPIMVQSARQDFVALAGLPDEFFYADAFTSEADKHDA